MTNNDNIIPGEPWSGDTPAGQSLELDLSQVLGARARITIRGDFFKRDQEVALETAGCFTNRLWKFEELELFGLGEDARDWKPSWDRLTMCLKLPPCLDYAASWTIIFHHGLNPEPI